MKKGKIKSRNIFVLLKTLLPVIFIAYTCCITFFTHTHIVNGVTIVHSHPYKTDKDGNPSHDHTGAELQLIDSISGFACTTAIIIAFLLQLFRKVRIVRYVKKENLYPHLHYGGISTLRPPPYFMV